MAKEIIDLTGSDDEAAPTTQPTNRTADLTGSKAQKTPSRAAQPSGRTESSPASKHRSYFGGDQVNSATSTKQATKPTADLTDFQAQKTPSRDPQASQETDPPSSGPRRKFFGLDNDRPSQKQTPKQQPSSGNSASQGKGRRSKDNLIEIIEIDSGEEDSERNNKSKAQSPPRYPDLTGEFWWKDSQSPEAEDHIDQSMREYNDAVEEITDSILNEVRQSNNKLLPKTARRTISDLIATGKLAATDINKNISIARLDDLFDGTTLIENGRLIVVSM